MKRYTWVFYIIVLVLLLLFLGLLLRMLNHQNKYHIRPGVANNPAYIRHRIFMSNPVIIKVPFSRAIAEKIFYVLPRAVFFDKRVRGTHNNTIVILAHLNKSERSLDLMVGCKVNGYSAISYKFEIKSLKINSWVHKEHPECTHDDVLIFCYDTPALNNSNVSVVYANPKNRSEYIAIESEHTLFIPKQRDSDSSTVMACTTIFDTPPHFGAWIRYQKTLGVDMVHINAQESFLTSNSITDSFFLESLHNGFIKLKVWKEYLPPGTLFYHSQPLYYQDCLYRYLGVYDYCICADTDNFLVSIDDKDFGIHKLVQKLFIKRTSSVSLHWIRYIEPPGAFIPSEVEVKDGNLTRYVNTSVGKDEGYGRTKSIYKLSAMIELGIHESAEFLSSTADSWRKQFHKVRQTVAYMAHIRKGPGVVV